MERKNTIKRLRQKAEELLKIREDVAGIGSTTEVDNLKLIQELQIHQVELELQNEELQHARAAAEVTNDKYIGLYDLAPLGYFTLSEKGEIIELNLNGAKMLGKDRQHLKNSLFDFFVSEETIPVFNLFLATAFKSNVNESCELSLTTSGNESIFVHLSGIVAGNGAECMVTAVDITEHRHAQQKLQISEEMYHSIFEGSPDGILIADTETKMITYGNTAQCRLFGYTEEQFKTMSIAGIHPEDTFGNTLAEFESVLHGEKTLAENIQCLKRNGEIFYADISGALISINGRTQLLGFFRDITARKITEQNIHDLNVNLEKRITERTAQLAESNAKLEHENAERLESEIKHRSMISNISDVIGIMGTDGVMKYKSPNIEKHFGWKPGDLIGTNGWLTVHHDDLERVQMEFYALLQKDNSSATVEYKYKCKDGSYKPIKLTAVNLVNDSVINGVLLNYHDISVRKQAEEALIAARNEADRANLAKSEFLSRMSHELRTPMNSILGFAQLMEMGEIKASHKKWINNIQNSGKHLLSLINEVLELAGIESGRQILTLEPVGISDIIHEISEMVQVLADKSKVTIVLVDSPASYLFALADKLRMKQVLLNLTSNAIKYNREGGSVTVKTELQSTDERENASVRISISDTGNGIKPGDITKLFQPFERIGADKTKTEGTGMGLIVVKELMKAMNGAIGIESEVDVGSTFWIELPLTENRKSYQQQNEENIKLTAESAIANNDPGFQRENELLAVGPGHEKTGTILYIEDSATNAELVEQILLYHRSAIQLVSNENGMQAVSLAIEYAPDLILLDLDLPDIQGFEVIKLLQAEEKTMAIPVVVVSADAMPPQIEKLMKAGSKDYLIKPLDIMAFLEVVDKWVGNLPKVK